MIEIPNEKPTEETVNLGSRGPYVSKRVWQSAYRKLTIWFDESGTPTKQDYKEL